MLLCDMIVVSDVQLRACWCVGVCGCIECVCGVCEVLQAQVEVSAEFQRLQAERERLQLEVEARKLEMRQQSQRAEEAMAKVGVAAVNSIWTHLSRARAPPPCALLLHP
jgi:hypothetical protein